MDQTVSRTAAVADRMMSACRPGTGISGKGAEITEGLMVPDCFKGVGQDIAEKEILASEE